MKKLIILLFLFCSIGIFAQQKNKINLELKNATLKEVITKIEEKTNFSFYYIATWLDESIKINEKFVEATIEDILNVVFEKTNINFYLFEKTKIILTLNSTIHNSTYKNIETFVNIKDTIIKEQIVKESAPIYITRTRFSSNSKVVKIGKENSGSNQLIKQQMSQLVIWLF